MLYIIGVLFFFCTANDNLITHLAHLEFQLNDLSTHLGSFTQVVQAKSPLFVSFKLPDEAKNTLEIIQQQAKSILEKNPNVAYFAPQNFSLTFVNPEDFSLTLFHLGKQAQVPEIKNRLQDSIAAIKDMISQSSKERYQITFNKHPVFINSENMGPLVALWTNDCMLDELYEKIKKIFGPFQEVKYPVYFKHLTLGKIFDQKSKDFKGDELYLIKKITKTLSKVVLPSITMEVSSFKMQAGATTLATYNLETGSANFLQDSNSHPSVFFPFPAPEDTQKAIKDKEITKTITDDALLSIRNYAHRKLAKTSYFSPDRYHLTLYGPLDNNKQGLNKAFIDQMYVALSKAMPELKDIYDFHKQNICACLGGHQLTMETESEKLIGPQGIAWGKAKIIPGHVKGQELLIVPVYGHYLNEIQNEIANNLYEFNQDVSPFNAHITIARFKNLSEAQKQEILKNLNIPLTPFVLSTITLNEVRREKPSEREYYPIATYSLR